MYKLQLAESVQRYLRRIDKSVSARILRKINWLQEHADEVQEERLRGGLSRFSKLREGDYRVLYEIIEDDKTILVHDIGHRSEIYRR